MRKSLCAAALLAVVGVLGARAHADVITFDDLTGSGSLPNGYAGVNWNGDWSYYDSSQYPYTPESGSERVYNYGPNTGGNYAENASFTFSSPVDFQGAYFAGYSFTTVTFLLYDGNTLVATSGGLVPTATPTFLASGYSGPVTTVVVNDSGSGGVYDYYVMDNVTYTPLSSSTPEPSTAAIGLVCGLGMAGYALRRRKRATA